MHDATDDLDPVRVFLEVAPLPPACRPAHAVRHHGKTLVWADPGALRAEVVAWAMDALMADEQRALRDAYGQSTDLSLPIDDELLDGTMATATVPTSVRPLG